MDASVVNDRVPDLDAPALAGPKASSIAPYPDSSNPESLLQHIDFVRVLPET